jgi:hypothetical protein
MWSESTVTWDTQPSFSEAATATIYVADAGWKSWTVAGDVPTKGSVGWTLKVPSEWYGDGSAAFRSKEAIENKPYLEITYAIEPEFRCHFRMGNPWGRDFEYANTMITHHFIIHYNTAGDHAVPPGDTDNNGIPDYVEKIAEAAEHSWIMQVNTFGFPPPPDPDRIDIYVCNTWRLRSGPKAYDQDNDYIYEENEDLMIDMESSDIIYITPENISIDNMIKVIVAHEFFHLIQANYDWYENSWEPDYDSNAWIDEGTAVWVEDEVFDDINAYLKMRRSALNYSDNSLTHKDNRYNSWLYWKFLSEHPRYGGAVGKRAVIKKVLEATTPTRKGSAAVDYALKTISPHYSFRRSFNEWTIANWLNGLHNFDNNPNNDWYEEGDNYRDVVPTFRRDFTGATIPLENTVQPWAADYIEIRPQTDGPLRIFFNGDNASDFMVRVILINGDEVYGMNDIDLDNAKDGNYWIYQANFYDNIALVIARENFSGNGSYTVRLENQYGYWALPFKFSDVVDNGDSSKDNNYRLQLRISTNPSPEGSPKPGDNGAASSSIENSSQAQAAGAENWIEVDRGRDHLTYRNELTGEHKQVIYPGPIHTWDGTRWVSYVFENRGDYYQVQHPMASVRFYPDRTEFYDEDFSELLIENEWWAIEYRRDVGWVATDPLDATMNYEIVDEDEVRLIRVCRTDVGTLRQTYTFAKGSPVKIKVELTASRDAEVRFVWMPSGIAATREVKGRAMKAPAKFDVDGKLIEKATMADAWVSYLDDENRLRVFLAWLDELKAVDHISLALESHPKGRGARITFGDFGVLAGEAATLDPNVVINPSLDGYLYYFPSNGNWGVNTGSSLMYAGEFDEPPVSWHRAFLRFGISGLWGKDVTSATLKIYLNAILGNLGEGGCLLHHIDDIGSSLDTGDWGRSVKTDLGTFAYRDDYPGWKAKGVTLAVVGEVGAGAAYMSFRLRGSVEDTDALATLWEFQTTEGANKPYLEVYYNNPPYAPTNPSPPDGATNQPTSLTLSWTGGDPDGDAVTYDVYFGTSSSPPKVGSTTSTSYQVSGLALNTTYYWQIVASDGRLTSSGPVWRFTTVDKSPTILTVTPASFEVRSGENATFTATLTSEGTPLNGKVISWSDNAGGSFSPQSGTTDSNGRVSTTYTAPKVNSRTAVRVTATFAGDASYKENAGSSTGTILPPNVKYAWVFWRFDNSYIDNVQNDGWGQMSGPENVTGMWSFEIPSAVLTPHIGRTMYWRVLARASDGRENWSPVYVGGRILP